MIICPNSSQGDILPIYKWVNTLIITNWPDSLAQPVLLPFPAQSHYPCQVAYNPFLLPYFHELLAISTHWAFPNAIFMLRLLGFLHYSDNLFHDSGFLPFSSSCLTRTFES